MASSFVRGACPLVGLACAEPSASSHAMFMGETSDANEATDDGASAGSDTDGTASTGEPESSESDPDDPDPEPDPNATKFDLFDHDVPALGSAPCGVDILFVIDNSGSMAKHKDDIVAAFGTFTAELVATLEPSTLVHVAITRATGFYAPGNGSGWNDPSCEFGFLDGVWLPPTVANNGINGQQGRLYERDGLRFFEYAIGADSTALGQWFAATVNDAIQLDEASNTESVVAAAAYPFAPINATYNAGFLR